MRYLRNIHPLFFLPFHRTFALFFVNNFILFYIASHVITQQRIQKQNQLFSTYSGLESSSEVVSSPITTAATTLSFLETSLMKSHNHLFRFHPYKQNSVPKSLPSYE